MLRPAGEIRTRFAPSPTGQLHLGHVAAMLHVWGLAARMAAAVDIRIEDHDRERCRPEYTAALREVLDWLGFAPCAGGRWSIQSAQEARYQAALTELRKQNLIYVCRCTRKDLESEHSSGCERRYPGNCRERNWPETSGTVLRVRLPDDEIRFYDGRQGWQIQHPAAQCGDLAVRDRMGHWTYQFAVVVDDLHDQINWVIRGDDLLASTGRQILLSRLLGRTAPLAVFHHPLILNSDGEKLSKRDRAAPLADLRAEGLSAGKVLGLAAERCGLRTDSSPINVRDLSTLFGECTAERLFQPPYEFRMN